MRTPLSSLIAAAAVAALGGCANWNAVKHDFQTANSAAISIDAKQRAIYSVRRTGPDNKTFDVVCAEPSPDALSSLAASLGLDAGTAVKSLGLAFGSQEAAASIGLRTQTIQTLRDAMYRLCEGYAGGAIDDVGFLRLQRRYQAVMLGLLAIEQLTGATVANQATLGGNTAAKLGTSLAQTSTLVSEARQKQVATQADLTVKKAAATAKAKEVSDAEAALKKATDEAKGQETKDLKDARDALKTRSEEQVATEAAKSKAVQAEAVATGDLESLEQLRKELDRASAVGAASAQLSGAAHAASGPADSAATIRVAEVVQQIVTTIVKHNYGRESCLDWALSNSMKDLFLVAAENKAVESKGSRAGSLLKLQLELCAAERDLEHEKEMTELRIQIAAATKADAASSAVPYPASAPAAAGAASSAAGKPPVSKPAAGKKPGGVPSYGNSSTSKATKPADPTATQPPAPVVPPAAAPAPPAAAPVPAPAPTPAASPSIGRQSTDKAREIIDEAMKLPPLRREAPQK